MNNNYALLALKDTRLSQRHRLNAVKSFFIL